MVFIVFYTSPFLPDDAVRIYVTTTKASVFTRGKFRGLELRERYLAPKTNCITPIKSPTVPVYCNLKKGQNIFKINIQVAIVFRYTAGV